MDIKEILKKYESYFVILFLIFSGILIWYYYEVPILRGEWVSCVDYMKEGKLYQGQPKCYHGPINFFITYLLMDYFPDNYLQIYGLLVLISELLIFFIIYRIIRKLDLKPYFLILSISFFSLFYLASLEEVGGDSIHGTLLILIGFYFLYFFKNKYFKLLTSSFFFIIAIFTRLNVLFPIGLAILFYLKQFIKKEDKKISIDYKESIKSILILSIIPIIFTIILKWIYPQVIDYSIMTQLTVENLPLIEKIKVLFSGFTLLKLGFLTLSVSISLYWFYLKRDVYSFISLFSLILIIYSMLRSVGYFQRYFIPILPFLIIVIINTLNNQPIKKKKLFFIFIILILSLFSIKIIDPYLTSPEFRQLKNLVDGGFKYIPNVEGKILADDDYVLKYNNRVKPEQIDILPDKYSVDGLGGLRLEKLGLVTEMKNWRSQKYFMAGKQTDEIITTGNKVKSGEYSMVLINPSFENSPVFQTIGVYSSIFFNKTVADFPYMDQLGTRCLAYFPSLANPCPNCRIAYTALFTNVTDINCLEQFVGIVIYYKYNLEEICELDNEFGKKLTEALSVTNIQLPKCESNSHIIQKLYERKIATLKEFLYILFFILLVLFYYYTNGEKNETI